MALLPRYTLSFYVPNSALQKCKDALFAVGAGTYPGGKYSHVCFEIRGNGQFRPNEGAVPKVGTLGEIERAPGNQSGDAVRRTRDDAEECQGIKGRASV